MSDRQVRTAAEQQAMRDLLQYTQELRRGAIAPDATSTRVWQRPGATHAPSVIAPTIMLRDLDFGLDDPVARVLLERAASDPASRLLYGQWLNSCPAPSAAPPTTTIGPATGPLRPLPRPLSETLMNLAFDGSGNPWIDSAFSTGNIGGTVYSAGQIAHARVAGGVHADRLNAARALIESGRQTSARVPGAGVELYDANHRRRERLRAQGRPIPPDVQQVRIRMTLRELPTRMANVRDVERLRGSVRHVERLGSNLSPESLVRTSNAVIEQRWQQRLGQLARPGMGPVLAFVPSIAVDAAASSRHGVFDGREFLVRQARSQTSNLAGFAAGAAVGLLLAPLAVGGVTVLALSFGVGYLAQVAVSSFRVDEAAADGMRRLVGR
ncbi:MAG: hypothetical protein MUF00_06285 [Gemmatimonadaceae bacterium]|jgi:hypothetical protein|nr:hypothetical protein [Gemmatimonadaceae bacterium]